MHKKGVIGKLTIYYMSFLICLVIVVSIALNVTFNSYKQYIVSTAQQQFQTYLEKIDIQLQGFSKMAKDIYVDSDLKKEVLERSDWESLNGIKKITLYRSTLSLADKLFLCFEDDRVFSDSGSQMLTTWAKTYVYIEDIPVFLDTVKNKEDDGFMTLRDQNGKNGILYLYRSPRFSRINPMQVGIYVSGGSLEDELRNLMHGREGFLAMTSQNGELILDIAVGKDSKEKTEILQHMLEKKTTEYGDYTLFHCSSPDMHYTIHVALETNFLLEKQQHLQIKILGIGLLLFLLIGSIFVLLNRRLYHPLGSLVKLASSQTSEDIDVKFCDEFTAIRIALEKNHERHAKLKEDFHFLQKELRKSLALLLMSGKLEHNNNLTALITQYNLFPKEARYAMIGLLGMGNMRESYESLKEDSDFCMCSLEMMPEGALLSVLVILEDEDRDGEYRKLLGAQLLEKVKESGSTCLKMASGMVYKDIMQIHHSYDEMLNSIGNTQIKEPQADKSEHTEAVQTEKRNEQVMEYIKENCLSTELSIEMVAEKFAVHRQKVYNIVKEVEGVTYIEYLSRLRCEKACEMLENSDLTIQEIVQRVGWYDTRNFTRKFKLNYGMTPGEYRQMKNNEKET